VDAMQILSETTTLLEISLHTFDHIVMENRNIIGAISKMTHLEKKKNHFFTITPLVVFAF